MSPDRLDFERRRLARAISEHTHQVVKGEATDKNQLAEVISISPLVVQLLNSDVTLDEGQFDLSSSAMAYSNSTGVEVGDMAIVVELSGYWTVIDFFGDDESTSYATSTLRNGSGAPNSSLGNDGDFYIDITNNRLYGPKTSGVWSSYVNLVGKGITSITKTGTAGSVDTYTITFTDSTTTTYTVTNGTNGNTILSGAGTPTGGNNGDFWIDTTNSRIYGPKASGTWPGTYVSLVGVAGTAATIAVNSTTTGAAGTSASVTNSGNSNAALLDFTIPRGDTGQQGVPGIAGLTYRGSYLSTTSYTVNDVVQYGSTYWMALQASSSSNVRYPYLTGGTFTSKSGTTPTNSTIVPDSFYNPYTQTLTLSGSNATWTWLGTSSGGNAKLTLGGGTTFQSYMVGGQLTIFGPDTAQLGNPTIIGYTSATEVKLNLGPTDSGSSVYTPSSFGTYTMTDSTRGSSNPAFPTGSAGSLAGYICQISDSGNTAYRYGLITSNTSNQITVAASGWYPTFNTSTGVLSGTPVTTPSVSTYVNYSFIPYKNNSTSLTTTRIDYGSNLNDTSGNSTNLSVSGNSKIPSSTTISTVNYTGYTGQKCGGPAELVLSNAATSALSSEWVTVGQSSYWNRIGDGLKLTSYGELSVDLANLSSKSSLVAGSSVQAVPASDPRLLLSANCQTGLSPNAVDGGGNNGGLLLQTTSDVGNSYLGKGITMPVNPQTTAYTATTTDYLIVCNSTTAFQVTLPTAATGNKGKVYVVKNINSGTITVKPTSGNIDASASVSLSQWGVTRVMSTGSLWITV